MKMRNKGKVHPSPSSFSSFSPNKDALAVLKLLPAAILALISVLSLEDKEVLAYMITWSMKSTNPFEEKKRNAKKSTVHKPPMSDCECFDCYTSYWVKWDSSSNRELIHQVIEAFEEHLNKGEQAKKRRSKKKEKAGRRERPSDASENESSTADDCSVVEHEGSAKEAAGVESRDVECPLAIDVVVCQSPETASAVCGAAPNGHKGLARKVLPDVLGLINSRLWSLWGPNV